MPFLTGGHFGREKTIEKVCSRVYCGKNMTAEVKEYVRTCDMCQRVNDKFQKPQLNCTQSQCHQKCGNR